MDDDLRPNEGEVAAPEAADANLSDEHARVLRRWPADVIAIVAVVAAGGVAGALARYQAGLWWPTADGRFPWTTLGINGVGCALIGVLMVLVTDVFTANRLIRPLLGTGVLGGFTTFSTYAVDSQRLIATGHAGLGLADIGLTVLVALAAVTAGTRLAQMTVGVTQR